MIPQDIQNLGSLGLGNVENLYPFLKKQVLIKKYFFYSRNRSIQQQLLISNKKNKTKTTCQCKFIRNKN